MVIGVIPYVPPGTTLKSFSLIVHRLNPHGAIEHTFKMLFGAKRDPAQDILGNTAYCCAKAIGVGTFADASSILENHTVWPFYAYSFPAPKREAWRSAQEPGNSLWRRFLYKRTPGDMIKKRPHACLTCVEGDIAEFGIAYWRVIHQLPGVAHCIVHHTPLVAECRECGAALASSVTYLPALNCLSLWCETHASIGKFISRCLLEAATPNTASF
jgi:hypothetical protein